MDRIERTRDLVGLLQTQQTLSDGEFYELFDILKDAGDDDAGRHVQICDRIPAAKCTPEEEILYAAARKIREQHYGKDVYLRGLIEFTNYCRNDCKYCGIRRSNKKVERYRLTGDQILRCCEQGYALGFRTFVLQGGEDMYFTDARICGIMVGSPGQTRDHILQDLRYMKDFGPHMIGIGPFIPHKDTPFADEKAGTLYDTLHLLAVIRLMMPKVLLPATTALGTIHPAGRELGLLAGANVIMPNISPGDVRGKYLLYDGKICTDDEAAACGRCIDLRVQKAGYRISMSRGDFAGFEYTTPNGRI